MANILNSLPIVTEIWGIGGPIVDLKIFNNTLPSNYNIKPDSVIDIADTNIEREHLIEQTVSKTDVGCSVMNTLKVFRSFNSTIPINYIGSIGSDVNGQLVKDSLEQHNIINHLQENADFNTTTAYVFLEGQNRTIITDQSASIHLREDSFPKIHKNSLIFLSLFITDNKEDLTDSLIEFAGENLVVLNLGSEFICQNVNINTLEKFFKRANIIIGNKSEYTTVLNRLYGYVDFVANLAALEEDKIFVRTDGENQTIALFRKVLYKIPPFSSSDNLIDTCGCGDSFAGSFMAKFYESFDLKNALIFANEMGAKNILLSL